MAPSRAAFRARFRALPPADAIDYLADLYDAMGYAVDCDGGRLSVARDGDRRTVVLADAADTGDADVVVSRRGAPDGPDDPDVLDPDDLYDRTRYAVDPAASDRLLDTYFPDLPAALRDGPSDAAPTPAGFDDPGAGAPAAQSASRSALERWSRRALLVAGGAVLGSGGAVLGGLYLSGGGTGETTPEPTPTPTPDPSPPVPGLSADGVVDAAALADAHSAVADAQSYTLWLSEFRHDDELGLRSAFSLELSLSADRSYLAIVRTAGPEAPLVLGRPPAQSVYWSDGEVYYVDHRPDAWGGVSSFQPLRGWVGTWQYWAHVFAYGGTIDSAPVAYFSGLFGGVPTHLVGRDGGDGEPLFRLVGQAAVPETDVDGLAGTNHRDLDLSAVVDDTGLVRSHEVGYRATFDGVDGRVRRTLEYTDVGETAVTRPLWAD